MIYCAKTKLNKNRTIYIENPLKSCNFSGFSTQIVRVSQKRYSLIIAAQDLRCGFGKPEVIDFFVRYI